jgi:hypothetical protein
MIASWGPGTGARRVEARDRGRDSRLRVCPAGCPEVVAATLEAERALEPLELTERRPGFDP